MWTSDASADRVLARLLDGQRTALGDRLVGTYLFGSAAVGSFEPGASDVDTVAVLREDLTALEFAELGRLHADIAREAPEWRDRVEAVYLSTGALHASIVAPAPAARTSPGEDFHVIEVDRRWILDWYQVRAIGIVLGGPPTADVIPRITRSEYLEALRGYLLDGDWLVSLDDAGDRCYAVLTMCRGLRSVETGDHVSKREGARWASTALPEYAPLIAVALAWRTAAPNARDDNALPEPDVRRLVVLVQERVRSL
jgi:streptomycin 3"-adenylyltransferase